MVPGFLKLNNEHTPKSGKVPPLGDSGQRTFRRGLNDERKVWDESDCFSQSLKTI